MYVASGKVKSNSIKVTLTKNALENALKAPSDVVATVSASTSNTIVIKWANVSGVSKYWLYYSTTNDSSSATEKTKYAYSGYSFTISENGTYYFWVKSADGYKDDSNTSAFSSVASCAITYASLSAPGAYYFWVKAADTGDSTRPASDFSTVATYTYSN